MAAGACVQFLEPRTVSICNTGIPLLCIFMLKRKCHNKGNMAADDGCTFPVISNEIVLNGWNVVFWKSQVVCTQRMWNCSPGTGELELHQRGWEFSAPRLCWEGQLFWKHRKQLKHHGPTVTFQRNKQLLLLFYKLEETCFPECLEILLMERTKSKYFSFWESLMAPSVKWVMLSVCQEK